MMGNNFLRYGIVYFNFYSVIDFGDTNKNPIIFELGITIMYMMTQCKSIHPNEAGGHVLAGYETIRTLPPIGLRHLVFFHQGVKIQTLKKIHGGAQCAIGLPKFSLIGDKWKN